MRPDGIFILHRATMGPPKSFASLEEVLKFAEAESPDASHRITVNDAHGQVILEVFA